MTVQEYIGAGLDIVYASLLWTILYMAKYPDVQRRVRSEVDQVVGTEGRHPSADDVSKLKYTEAVILEVIRHSSVVPLALPHSTTEDTQLNGVHIPAGTLVMVNLHSVNHDAALWSNPETFNPERFLTVSDDGEVSIRPKERCSQFGLGKRRCIGEDFSRTELVLYLSTLLQGCILEQPLVDKAGAYSLQPQMGIILKPKKFPVIVKAREL